MNPWPPSCLSRACSKKRIHPFKNPTLGLKLSDRNLTATGCLSVSFPVPLRELKPDKSAILSPPVPHCTSLSVKENDYESEGRRFESCRARYRNTTICRTTTKLKERAGAIPGPFDRDLAVTRLLTERVEALYHLVLYVRHDIAAIGIGLGSNPQSLLETLRSSESVTFWLPSFVRIIVSKAPTGVVGRRGQRAATRLRQRSARC